LVSISVIKLQCWAALIRRSLVVLNLAVGDGDFMRRRAAILPFAQALIVLRTEARKWLVNGIVGRLVLP
jgi:hypothetical protein